MPENNQAQSNKGVQTHHDQKVSHTGLWIIIGVVVLVVATVVFVGAFYVNQSSERIRFITVNTLSVLIAGLVAVQAYIYRKQWDAMERSLERTDQVIEKMQGQLKAVEDQAEIMLSQKKALWNQADAMVAQARLLAESVVESRKLLAQNERAVKAAEKNVETVEKTAIYANRAYVTASHGLYRGTAGLMMHLRIENSGNTPANDVHVSYNCELRESPPHKYTEGEPVVYDIGFTKQERVGLIPPKGSHLVPTAQDKVITAPEREKWRAGEIRFYCWGTIIYEDIFNERRRTEFCFSTWGQAIRSYPCEYGNRAD